MFGLENQKKKKKVEEFVFDLEKDLANPKRAKELKAKIDKRVQEMKEILRTGESKEEFDQFGILLNGYTALAKVLSRINPKT